jgi:hypothetical protein
VETFIRVTIPGSILAESWGAYKRLRSTSLRKEIYMNERSPRDVDERTEVKSVEVLLLLM